MAGQSLFVGGPTDTDRFLSMQDARLGLAGLLATNSADPLDIRTGVLYTGNQTLITGTAGLSVNVAALGFVTSKGAANGPYVGNSAGTVAVTVPAAPALGSKRTDVVWVQQQDKGSSVAADAATQRVFGVTTGTATTGTPSKPAVPAGAEEVGTITWDSTSTVAVATNAAQCTLATTCRWTVTRGAPIPVRNATEQAALTGYAGARVTRLDKSGLLVTHTGSGWDFVDWTSMGIIPGGWTAPTEPSGKRWQATLKAGRVSFRGTLANSAYTGGWNTICTLPAGIPAPADTVALSLAGNGNVVRSAQVDPSGNVQVYAAGTSAAWFNLGGGYPVG